MGAGPQLPPVTALYDGKEIRFVHPEASDPAVAKVLTDMMGGSPVMVVPELAQVPRSALADVFVFRNGVRGGGPFGFQPDVFASVPGDADYSPLRAVRLVRWRDPARARILPSAAAVKEAARRGEVTVERNGVVVNMPVIKWPTGQR